MLTRMIRGISGQLLYLEGFAKNRGGGLPGNELHDPCSARTWVLGLWIDACPRLELKNARKSRLPPAICTNNGAMHCRKCNSLFQRSLETMLRKNLSSCCIRNPRQLRCVN